LLGEAGDEDVGEEGFAASESEFTEEGKEAGRGEAVERVSVEAAHVGEEGPGDVDAVCQV
jgi:hypothetical protein